jgi:hypothetical protein
MPPGPVRPGSRHAEGAAKIRIDTLESIDLALGDDSCGVAGSVMRQLPSGFRGYVAPLGFDPVGAGGGAKRC